MRRRSVRVRQAPHRAGRPIPPWCRPDPKPRWWSWPTRLPLKEEITGSNPVRGTSTAGGGPPCPDRRRARRRGGTQIRRTQCRREAWGCKSPRRHNASRPGGPPAFVPPGPGVDTPGRLWPHSQPQAEVMERGHASLRSWCPPGRASASLAFRTRLLGNGFTRLLRRRAPAARTGGGGGRHPEEALVGPADRQRGSGGTVDTPGREPGAHKGCAGPSPAFRTQQASGSSSSGEHPVWAREAPGAAPGSQTIGEWCNRQHVRL